MDRNEIIENIEVMMKLSYMHLNTIIDAVERVNELIEELKSAEISALKE